MRYGITPLRRYPFHRLPPFFDAVATHTGERVQVWGWGLLFHVGTSGLFIGWLKRAAAAPDTQETP